jgi:hypothetical protein
MTTLNPTPYQDPVINAYIEMIKKYTGNTIKKFYQGDPIRIPVSNMPAIIVAKRQTMTSYATNAEDSHKVTLVITVVADIRNDISQDTALVPGMGALYDLMEGRDPTTLQLKPSSLLSIIRHNVDVNQQFQLFTDVDTPTKIDYSMTLGKRGEDMFGLEGSLTTVCTCIQLR